MNEKVVADALWLVLAGNNTLEETAFDGLRSVKSFEAAMVLTCDEGVVLRFFDGSEFLVTVKQKQ